MTQPTWLHKEGDDVVLDLYIQPNARHSEVVGAHGAALKIRLAAPPVDGKANAALLAFLAEKLGTRRTALILESGQASRAKRVRIRAMAPQKVIEGLLP